MTGGHRPPPARVPGRRGGGATVCDAQADVPSARRLWAQLAFKDSMVHGILQFTPRIAFRYVLHRCESLDIRCRESFLDSNRRRGIRRRGNHRFRGLGGKRPSRCFSLTHSAPMFVWCRGRGPRPHATGGDGYREASAPLSPAPRALCHGFAGLSAGQASTMILPQVHLRKPCYDFSFL